MQKNLYFLAFFCVSLTNFSPEGAYDESYPPELEGLGNEVAAEERDQFMEYFDKMFSSDPQKLAAMPFLAFAEEKQKVRKRPSLYEVVLLNDGSTPMEFVVVVLETVFNKSEEEALDMTLATHQEGEASCGVFTRDVAETKLTRVIDMARANGFPLKCILHRH